MEDIDYINKELGTSYKNMDDVDWCNLSIYDKMSEEFMDRFSHKVMWDYIWREMKISERFIENHLDVVKWDLISCFQVLSEEFILRHEKDLVWMFMSKYQNLTERLIERFEDKVLWPSISRYQILSEPLIDKFSNKVDWDLITYYQKLSEGFIERHKDEVNWKAVSNTQKLSETFIERFQNMVDWREISKFQKLSEPFIEKFKDLVFWDSIYMFQDLTEGFIERHYDYKLKDLLVYQRLSWEMMDKLGIRVNKNNLWQYKDTEFKKQRILETGLYECHEDYFIAYKAIRSDRYSLFNFQYQYLPNKTYESSCDCTSNRNSFGLNVGTYDFAERYLCGEKGIVVKCKVYYEDIGRIVYGGGKVRCLRITILE